MGDMLMVFVGLALSTVQSIDAMFPLENYLFAVAVAVPATLVLGGYIAHASPSDFGGVIGVVMGTAAFLPARATGSAAPRLSCWRQPRLFV